MHARRGARRAGMGPFSPYHAPRRPCGAQGLGARSTIHVVGNKVLQPPWLEVGLMIARNALLNLAGHAAPLLAALFLVPPLVARLGVERFGFLAIAWALVGYFS